MNLTWEQLSAPHIWIPAIKAAGILLLALTAFFITKRVLVRFVHRVARRTRSTWDDILVEKRVFSALAYIAPAIVISYGAKTFPYLPEEYVLNALTLYLVLTVLVVMDRLLDAGLGIYGQYSISLRRPMKGYVQLVKIFVFVVGIVVALAVLLGVSPWKLVSGIGALTAVLMLIFKDTILSLVASIQIASNDLLRQGDWIEMGQFDADGAVIDIALHTVKVQNWDKSIVSIPTNKFLDHAFKNWRGMSLAGGRRIKRALLIDQSSIRFLEGALLDRVSKIALIKAYLADKTNEIKSFNSSLAINTDIPANGRRLTNLGTFRAYALAYLCQHPGIRQDMDLMVRHLNPRAETGLPLEIYAFTSKTAWSVYEGIQSDIFDHLLAVMPLFELRVYQRNALLDTRNSDRAAGGADQKPA